MQRFLFHYLELFSVFGAGTPENPGGDFGMHCWIEAPDQRTALEWAYVLLGDYCKARYAHSADGYLYDGSPIRAGEIIEDPEQIAAAEHWNIPTSRIGEIPEWQEPWRLSNIRS
jgi:hypothetical protein